MQAGRFIMLTKQLRAVGFSLMAPVSMHCVKRKNP